MKTILVVLQGIMLATFTQCLPEGARYQQPELMLLCCSQSHDQDIAPKQFFFEVP